MRKFLRLFGLITFGDLSDKYDEYIKSQKKLLDDPKRKIEAENNIKVAVELWGRFYEILK